MRRDVLRLTCALLLLIGWGLLAAKDEQKVEKKDTKTLTGKYLWTQTGEAGDLEAVFTPAGENKWNVDFRFAHSGDDHVYSGSAEGNLKDGALSGRVTNEAGKREFTFEMKFEEGRFTGTHAEVTGGNEKKTGTLNLG